MTDEATDIARYTLERHEGLRLKPYRDTVGKLTIGYGRNLDDMGITEMEADVLLYGDIARVRDELEAFDWFPRMTDSRRAALINMAFNLGMPRLRGFRKMIAALEAGEYDRAAEESLDSKWARQVGQRAQEIAQMIRGVP